MKAIILALVTLFCGATAQWPRGNSNNIPKGAVAGYFIPANATNTTAYNNSNNSRNNFSNNHRAVQPNNAYPAAGNSNNYGWNSRSLPAAPVAGTNYPQIPPSVGNYPQIPPAVNSAPASPHDVQIGQRQPEPLVVNSASARAGNSNNINNNYGWSSSSLSAAPVAGGSYPQIHMVAYSAPASPHDVQIGQRQPGDVLLWESLIAKPIPWYGTKTSKDIIFPDPNSKMRVRSITNIVVSDNSKKGKGGTMQMTKGGVGKDKVAMHIKSLPNAPIDMMVEIYGFSY